LAQINVIDGNMNYNLQQTTIQTKQQFTLQNFINNKSQTLKITIPDKLKSNQFAISIKPEFSDIFTSYNAKSLNPLLNGLITQTSENLPTSFHNLDNDTTCYGNTSLEYTTIPHNDFNNSLYHRFTVILNYNELFTFVIDNQDNVKTLNNYTILENYYEYGFIPLFHYDVNYKIFENKTSKFINKMFHKTKFVDYSDVNESLCMVSSLIDEAKTTEYVTDIIDENKNIEELFNNTNNMSWASPSSSTPFYPNDRSWYTKSSSISQPIYKYTTPSKYI
jgi:hypothetical protein